MKFRFKINPVELSDSGQSAAVMLITDMQSLALIRRKKRVNDPWSGQIALPGGLRKPGEAIEQTAVRETMEEVGFLASPGDYLGSYRTHVKGILVAAFFSVVKEQPEFMAGDEVDRVDWVDLESFSPTITDAGFPGYAYYGGIVWGLTFRILGDCLEEIH